MPNGADYTFTKHDGSATLAMLDEIATVYVPAYADPPYKPHPMFSLEGFTERTTSQAKRDGFSLIAARSPDGDLAGFSFGLPFEAGRWWRDASGSMPPAEVVQAPKFAVIELVVASPHRGRGLAHRLINTLLEDRPEPYATLLANTDAPARRMYERWGWNKVADVQSYPGADKDDALILRLRK
ncbi:GNAT family N-acetyltransferase [Actinomadura oligospora]|uniref:GNAT family N-acetyltransferase n=1 Tax=Actinomadura oligospora TaxID=111804 RepID=UPI0004ADCF89|nr:GNAT family N-acetyltransferase [Actinomadura oligospora]